MKSRCLHNVAIAAFLPTFFSFSAHTELTDLRPQSYSKQMADGPLPKLFVSHPFLSLCLTSHSVNQHSRKQPTDSETSSPTFDLQQSETLLHPAAQKADDPRNCCSHLASSHLTCTYCAGYHKSVHTWTHRMALMVLLMVTLGEKQETKI